MNVAQTLERQANVSPGKPAVIFKSRTITFKELRDSVFKLADSLKKSGITRGDKVAIYLPNWPEYIYSYLAVFFCGATAVPLDFMLTDDELISCIGHAEAKLLIAKRKVSMSIEKIRQACFSLKQIILCDSGADKLDAEKSGYLLLEDFVAKGDIRLPAESIADTDYAIIFYTSGTTGRPKGVLINYRQLGAAPESMRFFVNLNTDDIALCALPFSHSGGLIYIQNCVYHGLTVVLMDRFIPSEFLKNIEAHKVTCFWIVPSMYYALLQSKEFENADLSALRWIVTFGASSSSEALTRFHRFCPNAQLLNGWGLTETNAPTTVLPLGSNKISSVGRPAPWIEVKIFTDSHKEAASAAVGEVAVKSWVVTDGYYRDPELTAQTIRDGWFYTGDLGRFDEEGHLYIVGRKKEMIKVAGEIVFEPEIEGALHKHQDIAECAVIGVTDKLRGEVPKAYVVFREGCNISEEDLRFFLRRHLAHFKIPHYFEFRSALAKNRTGKIDKEQLRKGAPV